MIKNSILLCTRNEEKYIESTINNLNASISDLEIVIVDDHSQDNTIQIIEKLKNNLDIKLIKRKEKSGLASAFLRGIIECSGENIGWVDTNQSDLCKRFPDMIKDLDNYDLILLSRYVDGGGDNRDFLRVLCSKLLNLLCRVILSNSIKDYTSSIFIMKKNVLNETNLISNGHGEFFIEFLFDVYKKNYKIKEIPYIQERDDDDNNSKSSPNLFRFFFLGFFYITRVLLIRFRRE